MIFIYGEKLYEFMEEKLCDICRKNYMGLWRKIMCGMEEKLYVIMVKNYVGLWCKIIYVYGAKNDMGYGEKLYGFMEEKYMGSWRTLYAFMENIYGGKLYGFMENIICIYGEHYVRVWRKSLW
eukprot:257174_1